MACGEDGAPLSVCGGRPKGTDSVLLETKKDAENSGCFKNFTLGPSPVRLREEKIIQVRLVNGLTASGRFNSACFCRRNKPPEAWLQLGKGLGWILLPAPFSLVDLNSNPVYCPPIPKEHSPVGPSRD